jgi:hypothetical protein
MINLTVEQTMTANNSLSAAMTAERTMKANPSAYPGLVSVARVPHDAHWGKWLAHLKTV